MTPEIEALARRAVACPRWRWMGGMFWVADGCCPECHGAGGFRWHEADGGENGQECPCAGRLPHYPGFAVGHDMSGAIPDLTDPATLGCLLALVREVWREPTLSVAWAGGGWYVVQRIRRSVDALRWIDTATEAEALVAALEAAP